VPDAPRQDYPPSAKLTPQHLDTALQQLESLPVTPAIFARLVEWMEEFGTDADEETSASLMDIVQGDQSLTARLLSLANRGAEAPVCRVAEAFRRLGPETVVPEALAAGIAGSRLCIDRPSSGLELHEYAKHCLAVALSSKLLAEGFPRPMDPQLAFVCGLLHDVGKLALAKIVPNSYRRVLMGLHTRGADIGQCERDILGVDHTVAGRRLAHQWGLPEAVEMVIWLHHQPSGAMPGSPQRRDLVSLVGLADVLARRAGTGFSGNYAFPEDTEQVASRLGLSGEVIEAVNRRLPGELSERMRRCGLDAAGRHRGLATVADAAEHLARINRRFRRRNAELTQRTEAFDRLCSFTGAIRSDVTLPEVLCRITSLLSVMRQVRPSLDVPVVGYALGTDQGLVFLVRQHGPERFSWRVLAAKANIDTTSTALARSVAAEPVARAIFAEDDALADWVNLTEYAHQGLIGQGRWAGGVFFPPGTSEAAGGAVDQVREDLAAVLGTVLAMVQDRAKAMLLSEQLAGASTRLAQTQQQAAERIARRSLGELAAGAAHELNNPLAVVSGRAQLMARRAGSEDDRKVWREIAEQAQRASGIVTALMELASPPPPQPTRCDVPELLAEAREAFVGSDHPQAASATVDIDISGTVPPVRVDREQMRQTLVELMSNAATAAGDAARIRLSARSDAPGRAIVTVGDNGPGMDARTQAQAFTPFYSLQPAGRRRGLGLPRARRCVEQNGGEIWIRSAPGQGTSVSVRLPAARQQDATETTE